MLIRVMYKDGRYDYIRAEMLDELIAKGEIAKFLRKEGWTIISVHPIRGDGGTYNGPERRRAIKQMMSVVEG